MIYEDKSERTMPQWLRAIGRVDEKACVKIIQAGEEMLNAGFRRTDGEGFAALLAVLAALHGLAMYVPDDGRSRGATARAIVVAVTEAMRAMGIEESDLEDVLKETDRPPPRRRGTAS